MVERNYEPSQPYRFAQYGRISNEKARNKRSPDQQFAIIAETIACQGYPWRLVATARDDGISGGRTKED